MALGVSVFAAPPVSRRKRLRLRGAAACRTGGRTSRPQPFVFRNLDTSSPCASLRSPLSTLYAMTLLREPSTVDGRGNCYSAVTGDDAPDLIVRFAKRVEMRADAFGVGFGNGDDHADSHIERAVHLALRHVAQSFEQPVDRQHRPASGLNLDRRTG